MNHKRITLRGVVGMTVLAAGAGTLTPAIAQARTLTGTAPGDAGVAWSWSALAGDPLLSAGSGPDPVQILASDPLITWLGLGPLITGLIGAVSDVSHGVPVLDPLLGPLLGDPSGDPAPSVPELPAAPAFPVFPAMPAIPTPVMPLAVAGP